MQVTPRGTGWRIFSWTVTFWTFAFLINNALTHWFNWPGASAAFNAGTALSLVQVGIYVLAVILAVMMVLRSRNLPLRADAARLYSVTAYIIRWAFYAVLLVGLADALVSMLRVEGFLEQFTGPALAVELGRPAFRGVWVHVPLMVLALVIAALRRSTTSFVWLALLVVVAELAIVFTRFIFSYEQAYMGDLVRFWYAELFLFASAYTLIEEGHVRVDVFYAGFNSRRQGLVNHYGSVLLGMTLCATVLWYGMESKASVINAPLLNFEVSQSGFGMYSKYMMAGFLAVFAVSMMVQFAGYLLDGLADRYGEPGKRNISGASAH